MEANLIVTYDPTHAGKAAEEVKELLEEFGGAEFLESGFEGVFLLHSKHDTKKITKRLAEICKEEPYKFKFTYRWMPVDKWCSSKIADMDQIFHSLLLRFSHLDSE